MINKTIEKGKRLFYIWGSKISATKTTHTFQRLLHASSKEIEMYIKTFYGDVSTEVILQAGLSFLCSPNTYKYGFTNQTYFKKICFFRKKKEKANLYKN